MKRILFLSGSLALAVVIISLAHGFSVDLFNYLFGSIVTVKQSDVYIVLVMGVFVLLAIVALYKELVYITFDEEAARVRGKSGDWRWVRVGTEVVLRDHEGRPAQAVGCFGDLTEVCAILEPSGGDDGLEAVAETLIRFDVGASRIK